jgi:beta-glucuronidase
MFTYNRKSIDLNGTWKFNPDPYMRCKQQAWWKGEGADDAFFPCFNMEGLWDIQVPGTWKTQFEELKWYDGDVNYVKDFEVAEIPEDHEAFLCFDGVIYSCNVYLNGEHVGDHDWGYSPFQLRVTDQLKKQNRLFVLVNNEMREDRVPGIRCDWNNDGGIINGVKLVFVPVVHIQNFRVETELVGEEAVVRVSCSVVGQVSSPVHEQGKRQEGTRGAPSDASCADMSRRSHGTGEDTCPTERGGSLPVTFETPELGIKEELSVPIGGEAAVEFRIPCTTPGSPQSTVHSPQSTLQLWSPDNPKLYTTTLTTPYETLTDEIGYREIKTEGTQILLNGEPIQLYGVAVHSEFPETGRTATPEGIALMVKKAKELGCNFLRCAHYPYADIFARAMDRAGMLWWEEVPVYWLPQIHTEPQKSLALGMLKDMIVRDWNRASLILWSVSNECAGDGLDRGAEKTLESGNYPYWVEACKLVRELDPSRLISSADSGYRHTTKTRWTPDSGDAFDTDIKGEEWHPAHPDEFYDLLDVLGANLYVQQLGDNPIATDKFVDMLRRFNKPLMITEFGSMSTIDENTSKGESVCGHPKRHEKVLREGYQACHNHPEIVGTVPWCLMDVRVPMHWRWYNRGSGTFAYGLLDNDYREKHVFHVVQEEIAALKQTRG